MAFRRHRQDEFDAELESHIELHTADNIRAGMSPDEARRQALVALGGVAQTTADLSRTPANPDARGSLAGRQVRNQNAEKESRAHPHRGTQPCPGHGCHDRDLQRRLQRRASTTAVCRAESPRADCGDGNAARRPRVAPQRRATPSNRLPNTRRRPGNLHTRSSVERITTVVSDRESVRSAGRAAARGPHVPHGRSRLSPSSASHCGARVSRAIRM